jgi:Short C-terminal domain
MYRLAAALSDVGGEGDPLVGFGGCAWHSLRWEYVRAVGVRPERMTMFGKHRLLKDGATARAVVTEARSTGGQSYGAGSSAVVYRLRLRVQFDDGSTAETACNVGNFVQGTDLFFSEGDVVPVRYDPTDRSKIELDVAAYSALQQARTEELKERAVARSEAELAGGARSGDAPDAETPDEVIERVKTSGTLPTFSEIRALRDVPGGREALQAALSGTASAPTPAGSVEQRLAKLDRLRDEGLVTQEEYAAQRTRILDSV